MFSVTAHFSDDTYIRKRSCSPAVARLDGTGTSRLELCPTSTGISVSLALGMVGLLLCTPR